MSEVPALPKLTVNGVDIWDARIWFPTRVGASGVTFWGRTAEQVTGLALHHDAVAFQDIDRNFSGTTIDEERARMQASYNWHTKFRDGNPDMKRIGVDGWNWPGMGYHLYAFPSGRIYLVGDLATVRAHVAHRNTPLAGLVLAGDFTNAPPVDGLLLAAGSALLYIWGWTGRIIEPRGHRQWAVAGWGTACPGNTYQAWVPSILEIAAAIARNREEVAAETRIRSAMQPNWDALNLQGLHGQIHYLLDVVD